MVAMKTVYSRIKVFEGFRLFVDGHVKDLKYHDLIADGTAPHQPPALSAPRPSSGPSFPDLPAVPTDLPNLPDSIPGGNSAGSEDVDFDDLTRRIEDLKKKK